MNENISSIVYCDGVEEVENLNLDPFREAITIPSLANKINNYYFLHKNAIEAYTDSKKHQSKVANEWLYHLMKNENKKLLQEFKVVINYNHETMVLSYKIYNDTITIQFDKPITFVYDFNDGRKTAQFDFDAFDINNNTVYEFYGDYVHGNPAVKQSNKKETNENMLKRWSVIN